jgi:anhydro-N-acetylmuramic acid kinase
VTDASSADAAPDLVTDASSADAATDPMTDARTPGPAWVGLMSGTSLDGISAAVVRFPEDGDARDVELLAFEVTDYANEQRERLRAALTAGSARDYCRLAFDLGEWLSGAAERVIVESGVPRGEIRAIGTHGQTIWHEPPHSTWQLGESAVIAERTGVDVVSDFRVADVAAGGEGAPLVPIADVLLFSAADEWRALQNIGGIGNVTIVPPRSAGTAEQMRGMRAFDTGPGMAVIDGVVRSLYPDLRFDPEGSIASRGSADEGVVGMLLRHPYFASPPPKSTGRELFDAEYVRRLVEECRRSSAGSTEEDIVATATALTAAAIADSFRRFVPQPVAELLVSGGGARNSTLVEMIRARLDHVAVTDFSESYFDGEAKEAVAFALLARLHVDRRAGNAPSTTGARGPRVLGKLTPAPSARGSY